MKIFLKIVWVCLFVCVLGGCVSLKGYRDVKSRMLYLEYERVNGPMQISTADTTQNVDAQKK